MYCLKIEFQNRFFDMLSHLLCRLVREAYRRPLKAEDMVDLQTELKSESAVPIFENAWRDEVKKQTRYQKEYVLPMVMSIISYMIELYSNSMLHNHCLLLQKTHARYQ
jgi:hypothetical protein